MDSTSSPSIRHGGVTEHTTNVFQTFHIVRGTETDRAYMCVCVCVCVCVYVCHNSCQIFLKLQFSLRFSKNIHAMAQLVEALRYNPEGCGFDSPCGH